MVKHRWTFLLSAFALAVIFSQGSPPVAQAQAPCAFTLGFKALHDQMPDTVGTCLENERFNPANGNSEQRTSGGLLVWRKTDNWTVFTNGNLTWLAGPCGLESRPNAGPTLPWEGKPGSPCLVAVPPVAPTTDGRVPGSVRTIWGLSDQERCYRLGRADKAQDQQAGVTLRPENAPGSLPLPPMPGAGQAGTRTVTSQVFGQGGTTVQCLSAYTDGYTDKPFQPR